MEVPTGIVTLVFTDIENSSALSEKYRDRFEVTRDTQFRLLRESLPTWNGYEVKSVGDALFVVFDKVSDAVLWSVEVQRKLQSYNWEEPIGAIRVRIGMHTGEPSLKNDAHKLDYFGPSVNRAARVEAAAHGAQILLSDATQLLAFPLLPPEITLVDLGIHRLRGVGEERLWQVIHPELRTSFPPPNAISPDRHNIPLPPTPYIGRESEIASCYQLLTGNAQNIPVSPQQPKKTTGNLATRLLTLTGFGGLGKTRTALYLAEMCVDHFDDGVWWLELENAHRGEDLWLLLAQQLRLDVSGQTPLPELVCDYLQNRELILVLDNSEQLLDTADIVAALLKAAPKVKIIVTSRRALELRAETVIELHHSPKKRRRGFLWSGLLQGATILE